jgi:K+-sensing histidine kinase KdpD
VAIHAGLISSTESHAVLRFEVRDTGIGISEKMVHQLFEPWTQANQSTFRKYGIYLHLSLHPARLVEIIYYKT